MGIVVVIIVASEAVLSFHSFWSIFSIVVGAILSIGVILMVGIAMRG